MTTTQVQKGPDEEFCSECGSVVKVEAEICPECGVRRSAPPAETGESYGFVFAFVDAWKRQKAMRHLVNIVLLFVSVGTYLGLLVIEALIHYRNLNAGKIEPYSGEKNQQVWVIPLKPDQYRSEEVEGRASEERTQAGRADAGDRGRQTGRNAGQPASPDRDQRADSQRDQSAGAELDRSSGSGEWLDEVVETEDRLRLENRSNDAVSATVGVRTDGDTTVVGSVELDAGAAKEWTEFPAPDEFEVGVVVDGEKFSERFCGGSVPAHEIEILVEEGGTTIANTDESEWPPSRAATHDNRSTREDRSTPEDRSGPNPPSAETEQSGPSESIASPETEARSGKVGGGKILLLGLAILLVLGPAISVFTALPGFVSSIAWAAGVLTILFGGYRLILS